MNQTSNNTAFVGRAAELSRLMSFCADTGTASALRIGVLVGEAGIGKSALIEQLIPQLTATGIAVIHAKIYPDSAVSPLLVLEQSLRTTLTLSKLLGDQSAGTNVFVPRSLRRIAHLRRSVIIIEDTHLIPQEAVEEFSVILTAIADEPITMILATRPGNYPANAVAARWTVEQIPLSGLQTAEIQEYLEYSFDPKVREEVAHILRQTTLGNPLALQSAVRQLQQQGSQLPHTSIIEHYGKQSAESVAEGFLSKLNENERRAATRLAVLGEVFSKEAADCIIEDSLSWIRRLQQLGILSRGNTSSTPIVGLQKTPPFAFTHTLVFQQLLDFAVVEPELLCSIIQQALPLYTTTVVKYLTASSISHLNQSDLEVFFDYTLQQAIDSVFTPLRPIAESWHNLAESCLNSLQRYTSDTLDLFAELLTIKIYISSPNEDNTRLFNAAMELTSDITSIKIAEQRLRLLGFSYNYNWQSTDPETCSRVWNEVCAIIETYPSFQYSIEYVTFLFQYKCFLHAHISNYTLRPDVKQYIIKMREISQSLLFNEKSDIFFDLYGQVYLAETFFLPIADNDSSELFFNWIEKKLPQIQPDSYLYSEYETLIILYMYNSGYALRLLPLAHHCIKIREECGRWEDLISTHVYRMYAQLLLGRNPKEVMKELTALINDPQLQLSFIARTGWKNILTSGYILCGAIDEAQSIHQPDSDSSTILALLLLRGEIHKIFYLAEKNQMSGTLVDFAYFSYKNILFDNSSIFEKLSNILNNKIIQIFQIIDIICIIEIVQYIHNYQSQNYNKLVAEIGDIHAVLIRCMEYFEDRQLAGCIAPFLDRYQEWFSAKEIKHWQGVAENLRSIVQKELPIDTDQRIKISMLGTISVAMAGEPIHRPQGDRVRSTLGLMVANEVFQNKLSLIEFDEIATGIHNDPDHARANMRVTIDRIRKMISRDAVITESGQAPRLNKAVVSVDLLEAMGNIEAAISALQKSRLAVAVDSLLTALRIVRAEVSYPTLYDSFFESARQEFEYALRTAILATANALIDSSDDDNARLLLQEAVQSLWGDEEIIELTCSVLERSGRFVESERLRRNLRFISAD